MRILAINDISCVGKCSLTVALPIISAAGITCDILPTAILSTHTGGFTGYTFRDLSDDMPDILAHWSRLGLKYDMIVSGYLGSIGQIDTVKRIKKDFLKEGGLMIVDPVLGDNGKLYAHFDQSFVDEMKGLCREADYITPNLTEAVFLTDRPYTEADYGALLKRLNAICPHSSITGCEEDKKCSVYFTDETGNIGKYSTDKVEGQFHGAGDVYAAAFAGAIANGLSVAEAVRVSADYTKAAIEQTALDGTEARYGLNFESKIFGYLQSLKKR